MTFPTLADVARLRCPACRGGLVFAGTTANGEIADGTLDCWGCDCAWPVAGGFANLVDEKRVSSVDRLMRFLYDLLAPLHDPATTFLLPLLQFSSEAALRDAYIARMELAQVERSRAEPLQILEVGIGAGANLPLLERDLPPGVAVDLWGMDLSRNMMGQCRRRLRGETGRIATRLLLADAHALPFEDASFDRVLCIGGITGFGEPRAALAEMARVAKPDTPIVVVDEQLDRERRHSLYHRLVFRALTFYEPDPRSPRAELPPDAVDVLEDQISRFFYCLTFKVPAPARKT